MHFLYIFIMCLVLLIFFFKRILAVLLVLDTDKKALHIKCIRNKQALTDRNNCTLFIKCCSKLQNQLWQVLELDQKFEVNKGKARLRVTLTLFDDLFMTQ